MLQRLYVLRPDPAATCDRTTTDRWKLSVLYGTQRDLHERAGNLEQALERQLGSRP